VGREGKLAREFPAGLKKDGHRNNDAHQGLHLIEGLKGRMTDPLNELSFGKPMRQHVREFGAVMALVACVIAYFQVEKHHLGVINGAVIVTVGMFVYGLGVLAPAVLKPAWHGWMKLAHYLGLVMTMVILTTMWVAVVIPVSLAVKILGVKVMDMRFRAPVNTYWETREPAMNDFKLLERQW